jgi:hypothetical protein
MTRASAATVLALAQTRVEIDVDPQSFYNDFLLNRKVAECADADVGLCAVEQPDYAMGLNFQLEPTDQGR